ncbi:MAG: hypothetical protein E5X65_20770 [Mesorhizobium sp.]|nr:MAG: hypothetical protein E5X65_20770 [Mesorhizobium sp.]
MAGGERSEIDAQFALSLADELKQTFLNANAVLQGLSEGGLLPKIEQRVGHYAGRGPNFLSDDLRKLFSKEIKKVRLALAREHRGVLMIKGLSNGFGLDVVVDIFNHRARRSLEAFAENDDSREIEQGASDGATFSTVYSSNWVKSLQTRSAPIEIASPNEATVSFLTLITDAIRFVANSGSAGTHVSTGGGGTGFPFTANCNLSGWILESWPQYTYSPMRFGSVPTWPVVGSLPTSGNFYFQGRKGRAVRKDSSPHYASVASNSTIVRL